MPNIFAGPAQTAGIDRTLSQSIMQNPPPMRRPRGLFPQMLDAAGYEFDPSVITNAISALPQLDLRNGEIPNPGTFGIYSPLDPRAEQNRIPSHLFQQSAPPLSPAALTSMVGPTQTPAANRTLAQSVMQNPPPAPMQTAGQMPTPPPSGLIPGTEGGVRLPDNVAAGPWSRMTRRGPNGTLIAGDANSPWVQDVTMPGQSAAGVSPSSGGQPDVIAQLQRFANSVNPEIGPEGNLAALRMISQIQQAGANRANEIQRAQIAADAQNQRDISPRDRAGLVLQAREQARAALPNASTQQINQMADQEVNGIIGQTGQAGAPGSPGMATPAQQIAIDAARMQAPDLGTLLSRLNAVSPPGSIQANWAAIEPILRQRFDNLDQMAQGTPGELGPLSSWFSNPLAVSPFSTPARRASAEGIAMLRSLMEQQGKPILGARPGTGLGLMPLFGR